MAEISDSYYDFDDDHSHFQQSSGGNYSGGMELASRIGLESGLNLEELTHDLGKVEIGGHAVSEIAAKSDDALKIAFTAIGQGCVKIFTFVGQFLMAAGKFLGQCVAVIFKILIGILSAFK